MISSRLLAWRKSLGFSDAGRRVRGRATSKPAEKRLPVAFMHIPKTSGVSITSGLTAALAPAIVVSGYDHSLFGGYKSFDSIEENLRYTIYDSPASLPQHADFVSGHFAFSTLWGAYPLARRLTLLREPCSRLLSHWLFWRQHTDMDLAVWGGWADHVRKSRQPLVEFLSDPLLACQTDNLTLRMLLWPHPLLPTDRFIDPVNDQRLVHEALARLLKFDFVDIVEDPRFVHRLEAWLGHPFHYTVSNETMPILKQFCSPLHRELTSEALELLEFRSRLDLHLWTLVSARHFQRREVSNMRQQTIISNVARYGVLMAH
jgi:hypothetical protein